MRSLLLLILFAMRTWRARSFAPSSHTSVHVNGVVGVPTSVPATPLPLLLSQHTLHAKTRTTSNQPTGRRHKRTHRFAYAGREGVEVVPSFWFKMRGMFRSNDKNNQNNKQAILEPLKSSSTTTTISASTTTENKNWLSSWRQRLAKMGVYAAMSYNVVSQINSGISMSIAWYCYSTKTGLSPLAPGQWKGYLAFYTGFWVVNNVLRPLRVALAVSLAPYMERTTARLQQRLDWPKPKAVTACLVLTYIAAVSVSITCFVTASLLSGVPLWPTATV